MKKKVWATFRSIDKVILALVVYAGVVLYWRGVWEISEAIFPPVGSLAAGVAILVATGYLTKELL